MKWVPVKFPPDFNKTVLLLDEWETFNKEKRRDVRIGHLQSIKTSKTSHGVQQELEWGGSEFLFNITYWMELPKLPTPAQKPDKQ
jgi:hypothetical protein